MSSEKPNAEDSIVWPICELIRRALESGCTRCVVTINSEEGNDSVESGSSSGYEDAHYEYEYSRQKNLYTADGYALRHLRDIRQPLLGSLKKNAYVQSLSSSFSHYEQNRKKDDSPLRQRQIFVADNGARGGLDQRLHPYSVEESVQGSRVLDARFHQLGRILDQGLNGLNFEVRTVAKGGQILSDFRYAGHGMHEYHRERRKNINGYTQSSFSVSITDAELSRIQRRIEQFMGRTVMALSTVRTTRSIQLDLVIKPDEDAVITKEEKKNFLCNQLLEKEDNDDDNDLSQEEEEENDEDDDTDEISRTASFCTKRHLSIVDAVESYVMHFVAKRVIKLNKVKPYIASAESRRDATRITIARLPYGTVFRRNKEPNPDHGLMEVIRLVDGAPLVDGYGGTRCALTKAVLNADWKRWNCEIRLIGDLPYLRFSIDRTKNIPPYNIDHVSKSISQDAYKLNHRHDIGFGDLVVVVEVDCVDAISGIDDIMAQNDHSNTPINSDTNQFDRDYDLARSAREFCPFASDAVSPLLQLAIDKLPKAAPRAPDAQQIRIAKHHLPKILVAIDSIPNHRIQRHPGLDLLRNKMNDSDTYGDCHHTQKKARTHSTTNRRRTRVEEEDQNNASEHNDHNLIPPAKRLVTTGLHTDAALAMKEPNDKRFQLTHGGTLSPC